MKGTRDPRFRTGREKFPWSLLTAALMLAGSSMGCVSTYPDEPDPLSLEDAARLASFNYGLAAKFWERDQKDLALRYLHKATRMDPESTAPRLKIMDLHLIENDPEGALSCWEECPEEMKTIPAFLKRRALALEMLGRGDEASRLLDRAAADASADPQCIEASADNLVLRGKVEQAVALMKDSFPEHSDEVSMLSALGELYHILGRDREEGETRMKLARLVEGDAWNLRWAARAYARAGCVDEGLDRIMKLNRTALGIPEDAWNAARGYLHYSKGEFECAASCFERAFASEGLSPDLDESLAWAEILMRREQHGKAAEILEDRLTDDPENALVRAALAWAYLRAGSTERSREVVAGASGLEDERGLLQALRRRLEEAGNEN